MAAWGFVVLGALACSRTSGGDPEQVVEDFIVAAQTGNREAVHALLGPRTRAALQKTMKSAERVSGRIVLAPFDFLAVGRAPPAWEMSGVRTIDKTEHTATVEVFSTSGDRHSVDLVLQNGAWKIELPGP